MVNWKWNAEELASECQSKEEAFVAGALFAIGCFRQDLALVKSTDMQAYLDLKDHYRVLKRKPKEEESEVTEEVDHLERAKASLELSGTLKTSDSESIAYVRIAMQELIEYLEIRS